MNVPIAAIITEAPTAAASPRRVESVNGVAHAGKGLLF
jgi:hypothetical protein